MLFTSRLATAIPVLLLLLAVMLIPTPAPAQDETFEEVLARGMGAFRSAEAARERDTDEAYSVSRFKTAIEYLERATRMNPRDQEAWYFLAYARDRLWGTASPGDALPQRTVSQTLGISEPLERVLSIAPRYDGEIVILTPRSKMTATWGSLAAAYAARGQLDSAHWALAEGRKRGGYPDLILERCANILRSCDSNAIVFVNGDDDTFPMWYLQLVEGFRRDVTIVNLSLTNASWYTKLLKVSDPFGLNPLPLTYSSDDLDTLNSLHVADPLPMSLAVPANVGLEYGLSVDTVIAWEIPGEEIDGLRLVRIQDRIVLDILRANNWQRPIYYSETVSDEWIRYVGLGWYLRLEGIANRVTPERREWLDRLRDAEPLHGLLMLRHGGFEFKSIRNGPFDDEHGYITNHYAKAFVQLAEFTRAYYISHVLVADIMREMDRVLPIDSLAVWLCRSAEQSRWRSCDDVDDMARLFKYGGDAKRHDELMLISRESNDGH